MAIAVLERIIQVTVRLTVTSLTVTWRHCVHTHTYCGSPVPHFTNTVLETNQSFSSSMAEDTYLAGNAETPAAVISNASQPQAPPSCGHQHTLSIEGTRKLTHSKRKQLEDEETREQCWSIGEAMY